VGPGTCSCRGPIAAVRAAGASTGVGRRAASGPMAVAVHPGVVATKMLGRYGRISGSVTEGAAAVVHLASPGVPVVNGRYTTGSPPPNRRRSYGTGRRSAGCGGSVPG
jgi:hypothetical protein